VSAGAGAVRGPGGRARFPLSSSVRLPGWVLAALLALPALVPVSTVLLAFASPDPEVWEHLRRYVLPEVLRNTAVLVAGVCAVTLVLGTSLAWLTAVCEFPGRRFFSWALVAPLAMPGYVTGFVAIGLLEYAGPLQTLWRDWFGPGASLPPIRSPGGIIAVMGLSLYPYVYLLARAAFLTQGARVSESARCLGASPLRRLLRVSLPMAVPWIAGGLLLVAMETMADFGTVSVFNYDTFASAVYKAWYGLFSIRAALQLAAILLVLVLLVLLAEQLLRRRRGAYTPTGTGVVVPPSRETLHGAAAVAATGWCLLVLMLGFVVPFLQLCRWALGDPAALVDARYLGLAGRSVLLSGAAAVLATLAALLLAAVRRAAPGGGTLLFSRIATLGYALPGTVLAAGLYVVVARAGRAAGVPPSALPLALTTMFTAYLVRYLAVAHSPVERAMLRIRGSIDEAGRVLGAGRLRVLFSVHLPMLASGLLGAMTLVFVDVMKEMPITLMTRPFGWDTLATRVFEMTAEGRWQQAAAPALAIAVVGFLPVRMLVRRME
jgi:iron(III) transport system permease protein